MNTTYYSDILQIALAYCDTKNLGSENLNYSWRESLSQELTAGTMHDSVFRPFLDMVVVGNIRIFNEDINCYIAKIAGAHPELIESIVYKSYRIKMLNDSRLLLELQNSLNAEMETSELSKICEIFCRVGGSEQVPSLVKLLGLNKDWNHNITNVFMRIGRRYENPLMPLALISTHDITYSRLCTTIAQLDVRTDYRNKYTPGEIETQNLERLIRLVATKDTVMNALAIMGMAVRSIPRSSECAYLEKALRNANSAIEIPVYCRYAISLLENAINLSK